MSLTSRPYSGHDDLRLMIELEQAITSARWPLLPPWHCGDLAWNAYTVDPGSHRALLWFEGDALAAFALLPGPDEWHIALRPGLRDEARIYAEGSAWAESALRPPVASQRCCRCPSWTAARR